MSGNRSVYKFEVLNALQTIKRFCKEQQKHSGCQHCPLRDPRSDYGACQINRDYNWDHFMDPKSWRIGTPDDGRNVWLNYLEESEEKVRE